MPGGGFQAIGDGGFWGSKSGVEVRGNGLKSPWLESATGTRLRPLLAQQRPQPCEYPELFSCCGRFYGMCHRITGTQLVASLAWGSIC